MLTAILPGVLIGAALGLLGGGGSVLTVPVFVYGLGFAPKQAIAMSLAVVAGTSAVGTVSHWRARHVNFRIGGVFGAVAMAGTLVGVRLSQLISGPTQLVLFSIVMLAAAAFMFRGRGNHERAGAGHEAVPVPQILPGALLVGILTGLVGVGGGFLIVPALLLMRTPVREAIGTSLLIITGTCLIGFVGYLGHVDFDWAAVALVAAGTLPGMALGSYLHQLVPPLALRRGFAVFLILMAAFIVIEHFAPAAVATR